MEKGCQRRAKLEAQKPCWATGDPAFKASRVFTQKPVCLQATKIDDATVQAVSLICTKHQNDAKQKRHGGERGEGQQQKKTAGLKLGT